MLDAIEFVVAGRFQTGEDRRRHVNDSRTKPRSQSVQVASNGAEGLLRNQRLRECVEGDPENGSRSDADSAVLDGVDRRCRFDLREGHDLERLLWPGTGSGDSTGLLKNFAVDGRRFATVEPI
jgi:hypothetical protein